MFILNNEIKNIIFDLDGTISDPQLGITKSINYALNKMGEQSRELSALIKYIGPPLEDTFIELLETKDEVTLNRAVEYFRERYISKGFMENELYEGIEDILQLLSEKGCQCFIATGKRIDVARDVVKYFKLNKYFKKVYGSDGGVSKVELLKILISENSLDSSETVMVGDRKFDIESGKENGLKTIGVLWGYGTIEELKRCEPDLMFETVIEMKEFLVEATKNIEDNWMRK